MRCSPFMPQPKKNVRTSADRKTKSSHGMVSAFMPRSPEQTALVAMPFPSDALKGASYDRHENRSDHHGGREVTVRPGCRSPGSRAGVDGADSRRAAGSGECAARAQSSNGRPKWD